MADWMIPFRKAARGAPAVRVNSPVLARYLDDLAEQARRTRTLGDVDADVRSTMDAMGGLMDESGQIAFGKVDQYADLNRLIQQYTDEYTALAGAADYNKTIESMMPPGPQEPFADALRRNDRTRALVNSRLDRLTPEQQVGSLGMVGRRADADAAMRRIDRIRRARDGETAAAIAAAMAAGGGAFAMRTQQEASEAKRLAPLVAQMGLPAWREESDRQMDGMIQSAADAIQIEDNSPVEMYSEEPDYEAAMLDLQEYIDDSAEGLAESRRAATERRRDIHEAMLENPADAMPMTIDIGEDSPISGFDPLADMADAAGLPMPLSDDLLDESAALPSVQGMLQDSAVAARNLPKSRMGSSFQRLLDSGVYQLPSPEDATDMSPGPESPVGMNRDLEDLPGPQMRSVKALMAAGIPEGRAMAIIIKGSSMSQDEYRMVTGGRR